MPTRAGRQCLYAGCHEVVTGASYCDAHKPKDERPSAAARGYDRQWRKLRKMVLQRHPLCVDPMKRHEGQVVVATEVDHILAKRFGGTDAWSNLQPLCKSCHSAKTRAEMVQGVIEGQKADFSQ